MRRSKFSNAAAEMRILLSLLFLTCAFTCGSNAQSAGAYHGIYATAGPPQTINSYLTLQDGNMGGCTHTFTDSELLFGPSGLGGSSNFNNSVFSTQTGFTDTWNDLISLGADGPYQVTVNSSAFCSCIDEPFYNSGNENETVYPLPAITSLTNTSYAPFQPYVDTPQSAGQYLVIWGTDLTAGGPPTLHT